MDSSPVLSDQPLPLEPAKGTTGMDSSPVLPDLLVCFDAPTQVWAGPDGQIRNQGIQGAIVGDTRFLTEAILTVDGREPLLLASASRNARTLGMVGIIVDPDDPTGDPLFGPGAGPSLRLRRIRTASPHRLRESIILESGARQTIEVEVRVTLATDLGSLWAIRAGQTSPLRPLLKTSPPTWARTDGASVVLESDGRLDASDPLHPALVWNVAVEPTGNTHLAWSAAFEECDPVFGPAPAPTPEWRGVTASCDENALALWIDKALDDLQCLRMTTTRAPEQVFLGAGLPRHLVACGRDALWAARMLLPITTELADSTIGALAQFQGTTINQTTAEEPGKIVHLVLWHDLNAASGVGLPAVYYGGLDSTPLWICLLHQAWRWGMRRSQVQSFLPTLERALTWMSDFGDADGDGLLEYCDRGEVALPHQSWKEMPGAIQFADGRPAATPIAPIEVQAYAYEAALGGAELLEEFGRARDAAVWRAWAARLAQAVRQRFWVTDDYGPYLAMALDGDKRPVDAVASNMGHALATGMLTAEEEAAVATRLTAPDMDCGFGLRTLATTAAGYWHMRFHAGAVWPHDSAIVAERLMRAGFETLGARLAQGLIRAATCFNFRMPELYGGDSANMVPEPVPYPTACTTQATAAAAAVHIAAGFLGLEPDPFDKTVRVRPARIPSPVGNLELIGLRWGARPFMARLDPSGQRQSFSSLT